MGVAHFKKLYFVKVKQLIIILLRSFSVNAKQQDTCDWVSQNQFLGGLDCAWGVWQANFQIDSYQWVNCDSSYSPFVGDTLDFYQSSYDGNVAVIIEGLGCIDTSYCHDICVWGIEEISNSEKKLLRIIDITGRNTEDKPNTVLIFIYSDGTTERVFRVE